ncbi:glutathione S-transferase-like protein [Novosphingobium nitrogenifigens DSM 19370]|uniref:Glutathione S-transferase-like protein n=1 Tax=Novosphingobium nitrogenifigens DSM 19370 TaxID=983920 RepID=F1Z630_9SPHN|nr:glutathione S-transferase family protein [Novosphingobium nitrogenifigens]EGD59812.1 glutathione S-transferase-like protein [Novosphingobium nitrogenifigens DSM 19370]
MYTLITANRNYSSWSLRPWLLMKALGIPFVDRIEPFTQPVNWASFRAFSPTGQVPALIDGETTVWDSLGIALYLADRHGGIWPQDPAARAFAQSIVTEMHGGFGALRNRCTMNVGVRARIAGISADLERDIARVAEIFEQGLDRFGGPWLTGEAFTIADAFYAPVAFRIRTYGLDVGERAGEWVEQVLSHPATREWEQAALAETWREAEHEADLARCGAIIADYRAS